MASENIAAISTGLVASGVAVIRISGDSPQKIAEKMFRPSGHTAVKDFEPNKMYVGEIECGGFTDTGMCVYFKGPKSFTGEDTVEFHCHGGTAIAKGVLKRTFELGARPAVNGEFTRRAFMNGKLSLSSAEGLIDMINSESESGVRAGYYLYREKLTAKISAVQDKLLDVLSEIDADMDFPEEDLTVSSTETAKTILGDCEREISDLLKTFRTGRVLKNGVKVGIAGKPNTGKSSLLNALLNYDKAIVSDIAGTTRDVVEGAIDISGVRFYFSDTAGIRDSEDVIERIGVGISEKILNESDLVLLVLDASDIDGEDEKIYSRVKDKNCLVVLNKTDKTSVKDGRADIEVSALNKTNIEQLKQAIYNKTVGAGIDLNGDFLCEERHYDALTRALEKIRNALSAADKVSLDLIAIDIKGAWDALGEISGKTASEEIINNIFAKFCVGK